MVINPLIELIQFLKKPNDKQVNLMSKEKIKIVFSLLFFEILFTISVVYPIDFIINKAIKIKEYKINYSENTFYYIFFLTVIIAPIFEELIFRYILRKNKINNKLISITAWNNIFPYLVYFSSIIFGLIHLTNYPERGLLFYFFSPLIVTSQSVGGLIIAFIRVRISFIWGIIYHCAWNFLFAILIPILFHHFSEPYIEKTEKYHISITEKPFFNKSDKQIFKIDRINKKIIKIKIKQYSLQNILDTLYKKDKYYTDDILINLDFTSKDGITKEEFLNVLGKEYDIQ